MYVHHKNVGLCNSVQMNNGERNKVNKVNEPWINKIIKPQGCILRPTVHCMTSHKLILKHIVGQSIIYTKPLPKPFQFPITTHTKKLFLANICLYPGSKLNPPNTKQTNVSVPDAVSPLTK